MSVRRTTAAVLAAGLLLAGCSDDPEPRFEPTESPSPAESSSSAAPESQSPEDFIREWFELNTEMQNTGETDAFLAASKDCATCSDLADRVDRIYTAGGAIRIRWQRVVRVSLGSRSKTIKQYEVVTETSPTVYRESAGAKTERYEGGQASYVMTVVRDKHQRWHMESVQAS